MASKRKPISKAVRFEVFKRDKFTCQYCGASAPDVMLEVDHIKPVSKGGTDDLMNLVTACRNCNRGKTNKELSDDTAVEKQKQQLKALQERREQLDMMLKWREELAAEIEYEVDSIDANVFGPYGKTITNKGRQDIKKLIRRFGFNEVYEAAELAIDHYYTGTDESMDWAFNKIGGICYNKRKAREENAKQDIEREHLHE